ncbi:hypothetical protein [Streptomyces sp. NPDC059009]|uniref:hypothetical protein n=1 Tax=Streptomyces sp. NPDC059009 TaxID=3346694 RepID=UPI0036748D75
MSVTARRSLLTTAAAGALLAAMWFVPSANATATHSPAQHEQRVRTVAAASDNAPGASGASDASDEASGRAAHERTEQTATAPDGRLADTGTGVDTTPYVIGGTAFLGLGAGFVAFSVRRDRTGRTGSATAR